MPQDYHDTKPRLLGGVFLFLNFIPYWSAFRGAFFISESFRMIAKSIEKFHEWKGRIIAYGGGSGVSTFSGSVAAKAQQATEAALTSPDITIANMASIGGLLVIAGRLAFDIWVYFDKRKRGRNGRKATD